MQAIFNPSLGCTAGKGGQEASLGVSHSPNVSPNPVFLAFTPPVLLTRAVRIHRKAEN